jgi:hypothetical protein
VKGQKNTVLEISTKKFSNLRYWPIRFFWAAVSANQFFTQSDKQQKNDVFTCKNRTFLRVKKKLFLHKKSSG